MLSKLKTQKKRWIRRTATAKSFRVQLRRKPCWTKWIEHIAFWRRTSHKRSKCQLLTWYQEKMSKCKLMLNISMQFKRWIKLCRMLKLKFALTCQRAIASWYHSPMLIENQGSDIPFKMNRWWKAPTRNRAITAILTVTLCFWLRQIAMKRNSSYSLSKTGVGKSDRCEIYPMKRIKRNH